MNVFARFVARFVMTGCLAAAAVSFAQPPPQPPQQPGQTPPRPTAPPVDNTGTAPSTQQQQQPPTKPKTDPNDLSTGDAQFSIELQYWQTPKRLDLRGGTLKTTTTSGDLDFPGKTTYNPGAMISIPLLKTNTIRFSYFRSQVRGDTTAPADLNLFGTGFTKGDFLNARYTLQNFKVSLDYLSYPFPVKGSKFRFKTLWELQYVTIKSRVSAPLLVDSTGASDPTVVEGSKSLIYPTFGVAVERSFGRHFRLEAKGSGFAIPHRSTLWDGDAAAAIRSGKLEILLGGKAFGVKTSVKQDNYFRGTLAGAYVALRYYFQ